MHNSTVCLSGLTVNTTKAAVHYTDACMLQYDRNTQPACRLHIPSSYTLVCRLHCIRLYATCIIRSYAYCTRSHAACVRSYAGSRRWKNALNIDSVAKNVLWIFTTYELLVSLSGIMPLWPRTLWPSGSRLWHAVLLHWRRCTNSQTALHYITLELFRVA